MSNRNLTSVVAIIVVLSALSQNAGGLEQRVREVTLGSPHRTLVLAPVEDRRTVRQQRVPAARPSGQQQRLRQVLMQLSGSYGQAHHSSVRHSAAAPMVSPHVARLHNIKRPYYSSYTAHRAITQAAATRQHPTRAPSDSAPATGTL